MVEQLNYHKIVTSFGAMMSIFSFIKEKEKVKWQQLSKWWYVTGVSRIQTRLYLCPSIAYPDNVVFIDMKNQLFINIDVKTKGVTRLQMP